jgi:GNAT superfamily N-acetyltransferase
MRAAAVEVRPAVPDDLSAVAELAVAACEESPYGPQTAPADAGRLREHLSVFLAGGGTVLVAVHDGGVCGFLLARPLGPHLFATEPALYVDAIYVAADLRRHGVGHALVAGAAGLAAEAGAPNVYCAPSPGARGMQRFLACLGFAPAAGHRVVATATLQRRLAHEVPPSAIEVRREPRRDSRRQATRAAIEDLIARRRRARAAGLPSGPLDLRAFQAQFGTPSDRDETAGSVTP